MSEEDYVRHTGKSPERDKCYRAVCWPDSQKYMGMKGCDPIQDENGIRDFGTSAYWVPLLLMEEAAGQRTDKKKMCIRDSYYTGEVFGYCITPEDDDSNELDSCWGFYGTDSLKAVSYTHLGHCQRPAL